MGWKIVGTSLKIEISMENGLDISRENGDFREIAKQRWTRENGLETLAELVL